eukprot:359555-Rhodomonas_salina.1
MLGRQTAAQDHTLSHPHAHTSTRHDNRQDTTPATTRSARKTELPRYLVSSCRRQRRSSAQGHARPARPRRGRGRLHSRTPPPRYRAAPKTARPTAASPGPPFPGLSARTHNNDNNYNNNYTQKRKRKRKRSGTDLDAVVGALLARPLHDERVALGGVEALPLGHRVHDERFDVAQLRRAEVVRHVRVLPDRCARCVSDCVREDRGGLQGPDPHPLPTDTLEALQQNHTEKTNARQHGRKPRETGDRATRRKGEKELQNQKARL